MATVRRASLLTREPPPRKISRPVIPYDREADMTFREFMRYGDQQLKSWGYSEDTRYVYERAWMQFLAFAEGQGAHDDLRSFNDRLVFRFAESLGQRTETRPPIHPNTIIKTLSALSTLARYGMMRRDDKDRRLVSEDPTQSFRWPQAQKQETKWVYPDEVRAIVDAAAPTYKAIPRDIFVETGLRVGEVCRLNVEHFREIGGRYFLSVKLKGRGQQRREQTQDKPLSKGLGDALRDWLLLRGTMTGPGDPLLINSEGHRWKRAVLGNMITRLSIGAGVTRLRVSPHKLRHSKNVRDRLAGIDAVTRARLNGHTSLRSQERYDHVLPNELHDAADHSLDELAKWLGREPFRAEPETDTVNAAPRLDAHVAQR